MVLVLLFAAAAILVLAGSLLYRAPVWIEIRGRAAGREVHVQAVTRLPGGFTVTRRYTWALVDYSLHPPCLRVEIDLRAPGAVPTPGRREARTWCLDHLARRVERLRHEALPDRAAWFVVDHWRIERLVVRVVVGTGDAAATALACGAILASLCGALAVVESRWPFGSPPRVAVAPDFGARRLEAEGECISRLRGGDIIHAGWLAFREWLSRQLVKGAAPPGPAGPAQRVRGGRRWSTPSRDS